jgi:vacuolar-type H+-ATPase subunit I/STV1
MAAVSNGSATSKVPFIRVEEAVGQRVGVAIKEDKKSEKRIAQLAKDATKLTQAVDSASSGIGITVASAKNPKSLASVSVDNIQNNVSDLDYEGGEMMKEIWSFLLTMLAIKASIIVNVFDGLDAPGLPVIAGLSVGVSGIPVALSINSVVRAGRVSRMLQEIRDSVDKVSTEEEKKAALLEGLKKLKSKDLDSLQERLMCSQSADLAKRVDTAISKLEKPEASPETVKEVEKTMKTLSFRAKLALGFRLLGLVFRIIVAAGTALLSYGPDPVSKLGGVILLGFGLGLSLLLFLGELLFVNRNPLDPSSKSRAQIIGESIRKSGVCLLRKLHIIRDQPATQAGQAATK